MTAAFEKFSALHSSGELFILPNAWNAESARAFQECDYQAIGTSSAAVATTFGYPDGEAMPFELYLTLISQITGCVKIPVTVDMEMGYGRTKEAICENIQRLMDNGVVGINLEDSIINDGNRSLKDPREFAGLISFIADKKKEWRQSVFVNVRCDTYLLDVKDKERETSNRLKLYEAAAADGIFLPFIREEGHITQAVACTRLPLNVMAIPGLPDVEELNQLGVKRLSMGPFMQMKTYATMRSIAEEVLKQKSIKPII